MVRPLPFPPVQPALTFGDVLQRLAILAPDDLEALETLARKALEERWPRPPKPLKVRRAV